MKDIIKNEDLRAFIQSKIYVVVLRLCLTEIWQTSMVLKQEP